MEKKLTLGLIVGNRGFFPDHLAQRGREQMVGVLEKAGIEVVAVRPGDTKFGAVETREESRVCANLFKSRQDDIDGVIVTLPNFGEERAIADALRWSGLNVPVLIQATPDNLEDMSLKSRGDSFCGKMSACNNLTQYGIPYSLTGLHTVKPDSIDFAIDLEWFSSVCRIVKGLSCVRIGAVGARPAAFNTVRYSEKLLEESGISVETVDLLEIMGRVDKRSDSDAAVQAKLDAIKGYTPVSGAPAAALLKMAKLGTVLEEWMEETEVTVSAVQCWTAMEEFYGVVPCTVMSMMSERLFPSACEVDVCGAVAMYALQLASGTPSALLDWNNNYGSDLDKAVCFHCSNLPKSFFDSTGMKYQAIIGGSVGNENAGGTIEGRIRSGPMTFARISTDDYSGLIRGYVGEGRFTDDPVDTFGGYGVVEIPEMQELLQFICENGFEHHVAANLSTVADAFYEATVKYMGWDVYMH